MARIRKRKDGRYVKKVTYNGKPKYFYGATEREVNKKIAEYEQLQGKPAVFSDVCNQWLEEYLNEHPLSEKYAKPSAKKLIEYFGDENIKDITARDITVFLQDMASKKYAQSTVKNAKSVLSCVMKLAVLQGEIDGNPCDYAKMPTRLKKTTREAPTEEEMEIIKKSVNCTFGLYYIFALCTGMRRGELNRLKYSDIDFERNLIRISKSAGYRSNKGEIKETKTEKGERVIPLLDELKQHLVKPDKDCLVFSDDGITPLTNHACEYRISAWKKQTGLDVTPHQCRHAYATILYDAGIDERMAMDLLGHANIATTKNIYTHISNSRKKVTADKLNEFMKGI